MDDKIEENNKVVILASSLPPSWEQLVICQEDYSQLQQDSCIPIRGSLKKPHESSFLGHQALTVLGGAGKSRIMHRRKARAKDNVNAIYMTRRFTC